MLCYLLNKHATPSDYEQKCYNIKHWKTAAEGTNRRTHACMACSAYLLPVAHVFRPVT